jgi:hypothetical protein
MVDDDDEVMEWADMTREQKLKLWVDLEEELKKFAPTIENMFNEMIMRNFRAPIRVVTSVHLTITPSDDPRI